MERLLTNKLTILLLEKVINKEVPNTSAMSIIAKGMELMETFPNMTGQQKQEMLLQVIEKIAAGADGKLGTGDDILSKECVETLKLIMQKNLFQDITRLIADTAKGKFNINHAVTVAQNTATSCMPLIGKCFAKKAA